MPLQLDAEGLLAFLQAHFPQALAFGFELVSVDEGGVTLRLPVDARHLRPGHTVSGPTLMTLADTATYLAILSRVGPQALAVTTNLEVHFLRRPPEAAIVARAELIKLGRSLAVATVTLRSEAVADGPVAFATVTYSLPPPSV